MLMFFNDLEKGNPSGLLFLKLTNSCLILVVETLNLIRKISVHLNQHDVVHRDLTRTFWM